MAIDFPASPSLNDTFASGGVTYTWDGTVWVASGSAAYVQKAGDTMSGNLEIGTGIDLNTNGSAEFAGYVKSNDYLWANPASNTAGIYNYQNGSTLLSSFIQQDASNNVTIEFNWDGSAIFAGGVNADSFNANSFSFYNTVSPRSVNIGSSNSDCVNNGAGYQWQIKESGDASGHNLDFVLKRSTTTDLTTFSLI